MKVWGEIDICEGVGGGLIFVKVWGEIDICEGVGGD